MAQSAHPAHALPTAPLMAARLTASNTVIRNGWVAFFPNTRLVTDPVRVKVGKVSYQMVITLFSFTHHRDPTELLVKLRREVHRAGGAVYGSQQYTYLWDQGVHLTASDDLQQASAATGAAAAPSRFDGAFAADQPEQSQSCTVASGKTRTRTVAHGTLTFGALRLHTPTSPFFGDITTRPLTATLTSDPGCRRPFNFSFCPGRYSLVAGGRHLSRFWVADSNRTDSRVWEGMIDQTQTSPLLTSYVDGGVPGRDLTVTRSAAGAQATLLTKGNPFITGSATFTATRHHNPGEQLCTRHGTRHLYREIVYRGTLTPSATSKLTAMFDSKPITLSKPVPAELDVVTRWVS